MNTRISPAKLLLSISSLIFILLVDNKINGQTLVEFQFIHRVNGEQVLYDTMCYTNRAGNKYMVNQVQYFISEINFHKKDGDKVKVSSKKPIHYVDKDYPKTLSWEITEDIQTGEYDSVSFTFGISDELNKSFMYKNPPESIMFWPVVLGGGYHYMKINVKYIDKNNQLSNFNCHLGKGRIQNEGEEADSYIDNSFELGFPVKLTITKNAKTRFSIVMDIDRWFDNPSTMDFNDYHGIMDNQEAMHKFCLNATDVFNIILIK